MKLSFTSTLRQVPGSRAALSSLLLALALAPGARAQTFSGIERPVVPCAVAVPMAPADPATVRDYNCYYFGNYNWNDGSGAGSVSGQIYWPSICGNGTTQPPGELPLPTVLFMHGDGHQHTDYHYLMRHLAHNGYIVATIQNSGTNVERSEQARTFLNYMTNHWGYRDWIDTQNIGLIGHSRGGEAVLTLARRINQLGLPYDVNAVISLAPTDSNEGGAGTLESLVGSSSESLLVIYGTHDEDVHAYCLSGGLPECGAPLASVKGSGFSLYDRAGSEFSTEPLPTYDSVVDKALLFIRGVNHNGFRSTCAGFPPVGNLSCATHQELAKGYMNAFLRWKLREQDIYRYYFSGEYDLPIVAAQGVVVHSSYQKGYGRRVVDNFQSAAWGTNTLGGSLLKESTVTVEHYGSSWSYEPTSPHTTRSLVVSWAPPGLVPWLRWIIPDGQTSLGRRYRDVSIYDFLSVRAGQVYDSPENAPGESRDFYVSLRDSSGAQTPFVRVSDYADLPYPTVAGVVYFQQPIQVAWSPMKTIRIPMCRFTGIDLENVSSIFFYFSVPGSNRGELILDNLEFTD